MPSRPLRYIIKTLQIFAGAGRRKRGGAMKFQIVSDSSCDLGRKGARELNVTLVSYYVSFGDDVYYREERDITAQEFYQRMADRPDRFPKTSMPSIEDYLQAFKPFAQRGEDVLCICLNERFSGSAQTARNAKEALLEEYPHAKVHVRDSRLATVLQGVLVGEAAHLRDMGLTLEEAVARLERTRDTGRIFFTTNDLEYLYHGGRIGRAAATTGTLLRVKPLIGYANCELVSDGIAQGRKKSLRRVRELFYRYLDAHSLDVGEYHVVTGYGLDGEEYQDFTRQLFQELEEQGRGAKYLGPFHIGATIGVHTGPYPIGVGLLKRADL